MSPPLTMLGMSGPAGPLLAGGGEEATPTGTAQLTFRYYMYGSDMGTIYLYWESGGSYDLLWFKSGQQHTTMYQAWTYDHTGTNLNGKEGETGKFVFVYKKNGGSSFRGDAAFCDLYLTRSSSSSTSSLGYPQFRTHSATSYSSTLSLAQQKTTSESLIQSESLSWSWDTSTTPSSSTGPYRHSNGSTSAPYIYFEASGSGLSTDRFFTMRSASSYTL